MSAVSHYLTLGPPPWPMSQWCYPLTNGKWETFLLYQLGLRDFLVTVGFLDAPEEDDDFHWRLDFWRSNIAKEVRAQKRYIRRHGHLFDGMGRIGCRWCQNGRKVEL